MTEPGFQLRLPGPKGLAPFSFMWRGSLWSWGIWCFPVTLRHKNGKPLSWLFLHPADPRGPCLVQPAHVDLLIFWPPVSHCAVQLGMHSVLHWSPAVSCVNIFSSHPKTGNMAYVPQPKSSTMPDTGQEANQYMFHSTDVLIDRCRALSSTFNSFCDLGQVTCLSLDFSFLISKARRLD